MNLTPLDERQDMPKLKSVTDALAEIKGAISPLSQKIVPISGALGSVIQDDIIAGTHHPLSDMSAMDGYGVRSADAKKGAQLEIVGESAAGHPYRQPLEEGQAIRIYTGGYAPMGCDAIILQEEVSEVSETITVPEDIAAGRFIRKRGQDFCRDDILVAKGETLTPRGLALSTLGLQSQATIIQKPKIAILSSGDELVSAGALPRFGQLINSNAVFLKAALTSLGAEVVDLGILPDEKGALTNAISAKDEFDLIVTTGGASVGKYDYIVSDLEQQADMSLNFWKIAMRPGKPLIFGAIGDVPLIGLPGNPVSVAVCTFVFLMPVIGHMLGRDDWQLRPLPAICGVSLPANDQREDYLRAHASLKDGQWHITPFKAQDSAQLHNLSKANAFLIRPAFDAPIESGQTVTMALIPEGC